ncbi:hypothetical protein Poli38472_014766 [Pythium oligandrum]|uniref:Amino acid transporter transmembrane domain-containing protein n=1 Tax=Pythium oligandrum TaxID=41045 RepID=A0A8K1C218_PYTOL|nr:hypothetical protein Poli38472_014766 [Pythium oligandrum]|eukprot:TMW54995.1 hypothetical protein Poli38472_014766 [Pythium oligandrum]
MQPSSSPASCAVHGTASSPPPGACGLTMSPVKHVSHDILETIKHQCTCAPVSMGEYLPSPRQLNKTEVTWLLDKPTAFDGVEVVVDASEDLQHHEKHATSTVWGSTFTLTNTILGSGTLAVPYAIASSGWLLGNAVMLAIALITRYSVYLLLSASDRAGVNCARTYESIGHYTMGGFGTKLAEFTFIFGGFGTLVSYFMFITDLFTVVLGVDQAHKWIVTCVCMSCVILPLSLTRRLGRLRLSSVLAVLSITYVVAFVLIAFFVVYNNSTATVSSLDFSRVQAVRFEPGSVYTVTLLIAAFACHNTALPVYDELRNRTIQRMDRAVLGAISIAFLLYEAIGLFGYLQFGDATKDNILLNFSAEYVAANSAIRFPLLLGRFCMAVALLLTTPIAMWPFRSCILSVVLRIKNNGVQTPSSAATWTEHAVVTLVSQVLILICSIFVPSVKIPLSIVGSVSGSLLIFIMPSLFFMLQSPHPVLDKRHVGPLVMFGAGCCVGVLGLSLTLYKIYKEHF